VNAPLKQHISARDNHLIWITLNPSYFKSYSYRLISDTFIKSVKSRIYSVPMTLHKHQLHM